MSESDGRPIRRDEARGSQETPPSVDATRNKSLGSKKYNNRPQHDLRTKRHNNGLKQDPGSKRHNNGQKQDLGGESHNHGQKQDLSTQANIINILKAS